MSIHYANLGDTVYLHFAANDTTGTAADGTSPTFAVRLCGDTSSAAPIFTGTPTLLTHATYKDGSYEVAIVASAGNGFAANSEYAVFSSLTVSSVNPVGFVGKICLKPVMANATQVAGQTANAAVAVTFPASIANEATSSAIKAKTDNLPTDPADESNTQAGFTSVSSLLTTIAGYIDTEVAAIKAKTDNLPSDPASATAVAAINTQLTALGAAIPQKNQAFPNIEFTMKLASDHWTAATGKTVTGQRSLDGGAWASVSGTIAEVGNGVYQFDASAADMNGTTVHFRFSEATCDDTFWFTTTRN